MIQLLLKNLGHIDNPLSFNGWPEETLFDIQERGKEMNNEIIQISIFCKECQEETLHEFTKQEFNHDTGGFTLKGEGKCLNCKKAGR